MGTTAPWDVAEIIHNWNENSLILMTFKSLAATSFEASDKMVIKMILQPLRCNANNPQPVLLHDDILTVLCYGL